MRRAFHAGLVGVVMGGVIITGCGGGESDGPSTAGPSDVVVHGNDALQFDQAQYTATAGTITIELVNDGVQPHTLLIEKVKDFKTLSVTKKGETAQEPIDLDPGVYTIYCNVPGHRAAGMEAKLIIS